METYTSLHGIGIRAAHSAKLLEQPAPARLFEAITENVLGRGGRPRAVLEHLRQQAELSLHGVSMSLGGAAPLDFPRIAALRQLAEELDVQWVSEHLCFSQVGSHHGHDLWPLPYTREAVAYVVARIQRIQDKLNRRLLVENVSSYGEWATNEMFEWEFVSEIARRSGCGLLLDINNIVVNAFNHRFDAQLYVDHLPASHVMQYHLAGHEHREDYLLDSHQGPIPANVWSLYRHALSRIGPRPTLVEWDGEVPLLETVLAESAQAAAIEEEVLNAKRCA